jgi:DnaJ family protein C protein 7
MDEETETNVDSEMDTEDGTTVDDEPKVDEPIQQLQSAEQKAEEKKLTGNAFYSSKDYEAAVRLYSEAIELCPKCAAYYGNRSAAYMMLSKYMLALEDARMSTQIDPQFTKGYLREAKCHLAMGEIATAVFSYQRVLQMEPGNTAAAAELKQAQAVQQYLTRAETAFEKQEFRTVIFCMDKSIELSPECKKFRIFKAECLALLKRYQESQEIVNDILRMDGFCADAIYVRGLCLYYQDNMEKAFQHFQQVLRLAPDHSKSRDIYRKVKQLLQKKEEGNTAFKAGQLQEAYDLYSQALEIDPNNVFTNSKLYFNRATVCSKMEKKEQAIEDCTKAIELDDKYLKAYLRRAKCYQGMEMHEEAVRDYEKLCKMDKTRENKQLLHDAKLELKKSKRKDYYKLLGIGKDATEDQIKKAYRKHALMHHPDRHAGAAEDMKKNEEKKFKEIGEAYGILSDAKKKARYDSGQDLDDEGGMGGYSNIDPNLIFQSFFGGGGGPGFGGFQQAGGGFPGSGFSFQFG